MWTVDTTAAKTTLPVVLRIPHLDRPRVRGRRSPLGRFHPMRIRLRMDVLVLLSAMPLLSLATYIGWKMATTRSAEEPAAIAGQSDPNLVRIEPVDSPLHLPDLSGATEIRASHSVPADPVFQELPKATSPPEDIVIPDPNIQPSSATIPMIGEIHLRHADYRRRRSARNGPTSACGSNPPCVRIRSVTPAAVVFPAEDEQTQGF